MTQPEKSDSRKVLVSPGFGAGWSTWVHGGREEEEFMLFDPPLIAAVEAGQLDARAVEDFERRFVERFGHGTYTGGARDLVVEEVCGRFRVHEYDGSEAIVTEAEDREAWR